MPLKPSRLFLYAMLCIAGGCAILQTPGDAPDWPLPHPEALPCCWQNVEQVRVATPDNQQDFTAAIAKTRSGITVVVLDALGNRLVTITHDGGEPQTPDAPGFWTPTLSYRLLVAFYLHHLDPEQWRFGDPAWSISTAADYKSLRYRNRERVRLDYPDDGNSFDRVLTYSDRPISLHIRTLSRIKL